MQVSYEEAVAIYLSLPKEYQSFYFHPYYVITDAIGKEKIEPIFLASKEGENIFYHAFHLGRVLDTSFKDIQSPYGYGGPIILGDEEFKNKIVQRYKEWCKYQNVLVEFIRFSPMLKNHLAYYGNTLFNRYTVYIDLSISDLLKSYSTRIRTAIKNAIKSNIKVVNSKEDLYIKKFIKIYTDLMYEKNTADEYFFPETYYLKLLKNENVYLLSAVDESGEVLGASIYFATNSRAEYHLSAANLEGKKKNVSHLLNHSFARFAQTLGCKTFYLGGGSNGDTNNSLLFYKKGFSKELEGFFIGKKIYNEAVYEEMRTEFYNNKAIDSNITLFYR